MSPETLKRNTAYKIRIGDIKLGKPVLNGEKFAFLELGDKKIVRVNVVGNVVDKYDSPAEGQTKYSFLTIDDGSGQIKLKSFGDDADRVKSLTQGQSIVIIGNLRHFSNEIYIAPEVTRVLTPEYLLIRKLELESSSASPGTPTQTSNSQKPQQSTQTPAKDKILNLIKNSEENGGIDMDQIIMNPNLKDTSHEIIDQEVKKMLEEGIIFEPRPGKVRWLG